MSEHKFGDYILYRSVDGFGEERWSIDVYNHINDDGQFYRLRKISTENRYCCLFSAGTLYMTHGANFKSIAAAIKTAKETIAEEECLHRSRFKDREEHLRGNLRITEREILKNRKKPTNSPG